MSDVSDPNLSLDSVLIPSKAVRVLRELPQSETAWWVSSLRLPCWIVPPPDAQHAPFQPFFTFRIWDVTSEGGKVQHTPQPTEHALSARDLVSFVVASMEMEKARPLRVDFADSVIANACRRSLDAIGVHTGIVKDAPPPASQITRGLAQKFAAAQPVKNARVVISPMGLIPGLRSSGSAVKDNVLRAYYALADEFLALKPWEQVFDFQTFRIRFGSAPPVWLSIRGFFALQELQMVRKMNPKQNVQMQPECLGFYVFFKRHDAEVRLLARRNVIARHKAREEKRPMPEPLVATGNPLDFECSAPGCGRKQATSRCDGCKEVYFCDEKCEKAALAGHADACKARRVSPSSAASAPTPNADGSVTAPPAGIRGEVETSFYPSVHTPFADLDDIRRLGPSQPLLNPVSFFLRENTRARPPVGELLATIRALAAFNAFFRQHQEKATVPFAMGADEDVPLIESSSWSVATGDANADGVGPLTVSVRTDPIITNEDAADFASPQRKQAQAFEDETASVLDSLLANANTEPAPKEPGFWAAFCCGARGPKAVPVLGEQRAASGHSCEKC